MNRLDGSVFAVFIIIVFFFLSDWHLFVANMERNVVKLGL